LREAVVGVVGEEIVDEKKKSRKTPCTPPLPDTRVIYNPVVARLALTNKTHRY